MKAKLMFRNLLILLAVIISFFFIFVTYDNYSAINDLTSGTFLDVVVIIINNFLILITLGINIVLIKNFKRNKKKKLYLGFLIIITLFNGISLIDLLWLMFIRPLVLFGNFDYNAVYVYLLVLSTSLVTSLFDREDNIDNLNYFLTVLVSVIIILVHYRYYVDKGFLHNMVGMSSYEEACNYVIQYYNYFIVLLIVLFAHKTINEIK